MFTYDVLLQEHSSSGDEHWQVVEIVHVSWRSHKSYVHPDTWPMCLVDVRKRWNPEEEEEVSARNANSAKPDDHNDCLLQRVRR